MNPPTGETVTIAGVRIDMDDPKRAREAVQLILGLGHSSVFRDGNLPSSEAVTDAFRKLNADPQLAAWFVSLTGLLAYLAGTRIASDDRDEEAFAEAVADTSDNDVLVALRSLEKALEGELGFGGEDYLDTPER